MSAWASRMLPRLVRASACSSVVALFGCNAILSTGDYHVGQDGGEEPPGTGGFGAGDGDGGHPGSGGSSSSGTGGRVTGGSSGKGTGGRATGGATATGGKGGAGGALTPQDLVGEWDSDSETITTDCGDGNPTTQTGSDSIQWMLGSGGALATTFLDTCTLVATFNGRTATISPPVACDDNGLMYMISGSFTIQADGRGSLVEVVTFTTSGVTCTLTGKGIYTKFMP